MRDRDATVNKLQRQNKKKRNTNNISRQVFERMPATNTLIEKVEVEAQTSHPVMETSSSEEEDDSDAEVVKPTKPVPNVRVYDYEELKREAGFW